MSATGHYDVIGDIHGHHRPLEALLRQLGYEQRGGAWRHSERTAIFVGDFIDRGPEQVAVVETVRAMVSAGSALAIMGNHELNAIAYFHTDPKTGAPLRRHDKKNKSQHAAFLSAVDGKTIHGDFISWFMSLPLWLDLPGLQVVHACWHPSSLRHLEGRLKDGRLSLEQLPEATLEPEDEREKDTPAPTLFKSVDALTKGIEAPLPEGVVFHDSDGHERKRTRVPWWKREATLRNSLGISEEARAQLPAHPFPSHAHAGMDRTMPVLFGHYWMNGPPKLQGPLAACVDYSIAKRGLLCAYRFDGEPELQASKLFSVA